jgi:hypothetical protein
MNLILLGSLLVLGRGSRGMMGDYWSHLCKPLIGAIIGVLLGADGWVLLAFAAVYYVSESTAPAPFCTGLITDKYEFNPNRKAAWFEIEYLQRRPYLGVTVRGFISFLICSLLFFFHNVALLVVLPLVWVAALYAGTKLPSINKMDAWQWAEILRPFLIGLVLCVPLL